jgi:hypothetical protein
MGSLQISTADFRRADLEQPLQMEERFDLAISLEVAEHLSSARAPGFVEDLTHLSDVILFSAAIPGQGGTNHLNEQWLSYWVEQFSRFDYQKIDILRPIILKNSSIPYFYRQNSLLFANNQGLHLHPQLMSAATTSRDSILDIVHPELYEILHRKLSKRVKVKKWIRKLPESWWRSTLKKR